MTLKLGVQHQGFEVYKVDINDDTGLTLSDFNKNEKNCCNVI